MKKAELKVDLIDFTGCGSADPEWYAARLLAFTKNTRLEMEPAGFNTFLRAPLEDIEAELKYMARTIPSSWEFVNATFVIRNVSRACAQQITRTRWSPVEGDLYGSYAMQSQRVSDASAAPVHMPDRLALSPVSANSQLYEIAVDESMSNYSMAIRMGMDPEDARGLLPMNVGCNLALQYNLRVLSEVCRKRKSLRVQGEFNRVAALMREAIEEVWPWVSMFFEPKESQAVQIIEEVAATLPKEQKLLLAKAADLLKV